MVGFYSWQVSTVDCTSIESVDPNARKTSNWESDPNLCKLIRYELPMRHPI
jgi:hypothetical protein